MSDELQKNADERMDETNKQLAAMFQLTDAEMKATIFRLGVMAAWGHVDFFNEHSGGFIDTGEAFRKSLRGPE